MFRNHCDPNFRTKLRRRCVAQGNLPPFCIIALAEFATRNVPMPVLMQFHRGFREIFTACWQFFRMEFESTCVSQGISPPFCLAALVPFPSHNVKPQPFPLYHGGFHDVLTTCSQKKLHEIRTDVRFAGDFTSIWRRCPGTFAVPDCAFMIYHRGFRIFPIPNRAISMFIA
jgi:hypothetical protein